MALRCPRCGKEFDVTLFEFNREVVCPCGERLSMKKGHEIRRGPAKRKGEKPSRPARGGKSAEGESREGGGERRPISDIDWDSFEKEIFGAVDARARLLDRMRADEIRGMADRIVELIRQSDLPRVDIEIEIRNFREYVLEHFPEKEGLFKAIYINRFRRLWDEHRKGQGPLFGPGSRPR